MTIDAFLAIITVVLPLITTGLTTLIKKLPAFAAIQTNREPKIRLLVAVVAFIGVLVTSYASGVYDQTVLGGAVSTVLLTFGVWISSLGIWHSTKPSPAT